MCVVWGNIAVWFTDKLLPPLLAAGAAAWVLARLLENHRAQRDFLSREVEDIRATLKAFWDTCLEYWLPEKLEDQKALEEKIALMQDEILGGVQILGTHFKKEFSEGATDILIDLAKEATGGRFRDPERKPDPERVGRLRIIIVKLRQKLQSARRESLKRPWKIGH